MKLTKRSFLTLIFITLVIVILCTSTVFAGAIKDKAQSFANDNMGDIIFVGKIVIAFLAVGSLVGAFSANNDTISNIAKGVFIASIIALLLLFIIPGMFGITPTTTT